jgi:uncharacterized membrane protein
MVWSHPHDGRLYLTLAVVLAGILVLASRLANAPSARSKVLLVLRALAVGVLVLILLNPVRVQETRYRGPEPAAVFLLDESRSMSLEKPFSRAQAVDRLIQNAEAMMPAQARPEIQTFGFGSDLVARLEHAAAPQPVADLTRLAWALEQLPARFGASLPFGVFVFSDGRSTDAVPLEPIARAFRNLGVPIHVVPVGDPRVSGDVAVQDIDAPRDALPGTRVPIRVTLRSRGFDGQRTELKVRSVAEPRADPLVTLPIILTGGEQAHDLVVETDKAKGPLNVEVSLLPHEAIGANNIVPIEITRREPKLRVIYMEGTVGPEYAYLQNALEEDPAIKCVSLNVDNQLADSPVLHRINDPGHGFPQTREELLSYDVVICSDIARTAFTQEQLEWTVELVSKRGGGFVMIGGYTSFGAGGWDQTIWDELIPVDMKGRGLARSEYYNGNLRVVIPPKASMHPIWRIVDDPEQNRQVLDRMPTFGGTNLTDRLKPAATALGLSERPLEGSSLVTVFSCQSFGRGRTFAMATDTTYGWGTEFEKTWGEGDNRYFRKFWRNVIRWLTENSTGANRRLHVETDKVIYRSGQDIQVIARAYDEKLKETNRYRVDARVHGPRESASLPGGEGGANLVPQLGNASYAGKLAAPPAGRSLEDAGSTLHPLLLDVTAHDGDTVAATWSGQLQVIDDPAEFWDPRPDFAQLERLAQAASGRVIKTPGELATLLEQHPKASVRTVAMRWPLWDSPLLWLVILGLLVSEWIIRRLKGLA